MDWTWKDLFDKRFKNELQTVISSYLFRLGRFTVIMTMVVYFFAVGVAPTPSMVPTVYPKDMLVLKKQVDTFQRGDIVAFLSPMDNKTMLLKRIIALPGEQVEVKWGKVFVNGDELTEPYVAERMYYEYSLAVVPEGSYFMLGDNRNHSEDSHVFGTVEEERIKGKVVMILLPIKHLQYL